MLYKFAALMLSAISLLAFVPAAESTHGDAAVYARDDGSLAAAGRYLNGGGNTQTWEFRVTSGGLPATCRGFGSIEIGFTGTCLTTSGTGHFHDYPNLDGPDVHDVTVNGAPGKLVSN